MLKLQVSEFFRAASQFVVVEPRSPQVRFPLHEHDFYEIVIVSSGNGWHVLNDEPHFISCGEVLFLRAAAGWRGRRAAYGTIAGFAFAVLVLVLYLVRKEPPPPVAWVFP